MTRKIFRFFKHQGCITSIKDGVEKLGALLRKYEQTSKHNSRLKQRFFASRGSVSNLEVILDEESLETGSDVQPEESELRIIKSPQFIDSKLQLGLKILHRVLGLVEDCFGLLYYFMDHFCFLGRIEVITSPGVKKVSLG